jgi:hypothetical protein
MGKVTLNNNQVEDLKKLQLKTKIEEIDYSILLKSCKRDSLLFYNDLVISRLVEADIIKINITNIPNSIEGKKQEYIESHSKEMQEAKLKISDKSNFEYYYSKFKILVLYGVMTETTRKLEFISYLTNTSEQQKQRLISLGTLFKCRSLINNKIYRR